MQTPTGIRLTVHCPTKETRAARESTDGDKKHGHVANVGVLDPSQDGEANHGEAGKRTQPDTTLPGLVAEPRHGDGNHAGAHVGRHRVKLRLGVGPAEVVEDGGQEHRETLDGDVDEEEGQGAGVVVDAENSSLDIGPGDLPGGIRPVLTQQTLSGDLSLAFVEEVGGRRISRHPNGRQKTNDDGDETLKEEDVAPRVDLGARDSPRGDLGQGGGQETTKSTGDGSSRDVNTDAEQELVALVEAAQEEGHTRHGTTLKDTQERTGDHEASEILDEGGAQRDEAEAADEKWEVETRSDGLEEDVAGHLDEQVDDVEDGEGPVELDAFHHVEVPGQSLDTRIADVDAVEEAQHVEERHQRHRVPVDLAADDGLLLLSVVELELLGRGAILGGCRALLQRLLGCEDVLVFSSFGSLSSLGERLSARF